MHVFIASRTVPLSALVDNGIIYFIIGDMMFYPDYMNVVNGSRSLSAFKGTLDSSEYPAVAVCVSRYIISIRNTKKCELVSKYLPSGLLFRHVSQVLFYTKELVGI